MAAATKGRRAKPAEPWRVDANALTGARPLAVYQGQRFVAQAGTEADATKIVRALTAHDELVAALSEFEIEDCPRCAGSGHEPENEGDACNRCGGAGEIIRGGWPRHVRDALSKAAQP